MISWLLWFFNSPIKELTVFEFLLICIVMFGFGYLMRIVKELEI